MPAFFQNQKEGERPLITDKILAKITQMGYQNVRINLWHEVLLFVNIKGMPPFYYQMENSCRIASQKKLPEILFSDMRKLCWFLQANKADIVNEMADGAYYAA